MASYQKLIEKNPNWNGKAKIVGLSINSKIEDIVNKVNSTNAKSVEHYKFVNEWDEENEFLLFLQQIYCPCVLLVNKWGKIVYMGNSYDADLEDRINQEINAEQDTAQVQENIQENTQMKEQLISKEEYKQLKEKMESIQAALNKCAFESAYLKISLERINIWKSGGQKEVLKRSKLTLYCEYTLSQKEKLNQFLENHWNTIPENLRQVKEVPVDAQLNEIKAKFQETFGALGITVNYFDRNTLRNKYDSEQQQFKSKLYTEFSVEAKNLSNEIFESGMQNLKAYLSKIEDREDDENILLVRLIRSIVPKLEQNIIIEVGDQFRTIKDYKKWGSEEYTTIEHKPGQILFFFYWLSWSSSCIERVEEVTEIVRKNAKKWGNDVRVVALSQDLGGESEAVMNAHQESQKFIDFYFPKQMAQKDIQIYSHQSISIYIFVDKFGTVREIAKHDYVNVEELITSLLNEQIPYVKQEPSGPQIDPTKIHSILMSSQEIFAQADPLKIIQFELIIKSKAYDNGVVILSKPELKYFFRDHQELEIQTVLNQLFNAVPEEQWIIQKTIQKTISIPYPGKECAVCKKEISLEPQQYYSPFKNEYVCTECAEADDKEKKGNGRFKYLDTLVFINGPLSDPSVLQHIDDHKIGSNIKLSEEDEGS